MSTCLYKLKSKPKLETKLSKLTEIKEGSETKIGTEFSNIAFKFSCQCIKYAKNEQSNIAYSLIFMV